MSDQRDAARYRRLRENWIDCDEIGLHGRTVVIDAAIDRLLNAEPQADSRQPVEVADRKPAAAPAAAAPLLDPGQCWKCHGRMTACAFKCADSECPWGGRAL